MVRTFSILLALALLAALAWPWLPTHDLEGYLSFADQRTWLGIPCFMDVASNVAFLAVGHWGLRRILGNQKNFPPGFRACFVALSIAIVLVTVGSSYFHLEPSLDRLFWDRLPMSLGFASLVALIVADRLGDREGLLTLWAGLPVALAAITGWKFEVFDLRPYVLVQFGGLGVALLITVVRPRGLISNRAIWGSVGLYALAKIFELLDRRVFSLSGVISGHTIKHLIAAAGIALLFWAAQAGPTPGVKNRSRLASAS
jgi:hypothetical protein